MVSLQLALNFYFCSRKPEVTGLFFGYMCCDKLTVNLLSFIRSTASSSRSLLFKQKTQTSLLKVYVVSGYFLVLFPKSRPANN